jgi:hypothetical protein
MLYESSMDLQAIAPSSYMHSDGTRLAASVMILRPAPRCGARHTPAASIFSALLVATVPSIAALAPACAGQMTKPADQETTVNRESAGDSKGTSAPRGVRGLPQANPDRVFFSLDEYLAHRARVAAMGAPALREISPGRYAEEFRDGTSHSSTREELLRKFGFTR